MGTTKIEWADAVWNPVTGCTKVSAGCANCYAERLVTRFGGKIHDGPFGRVICHCDRLDPPLHWRKPRRVFVCSMGDLFHEDVPDGYIDAVFAAMAMAPKITFMILTKRPDVALKWFSYDQGCRLRPCRVSEACLDVFHLDSEAEDPVGAWPLRNVWLGVSVENQATADERIPLLLRTPAAVRFVSVEPMLGPVDLCRWLAPECIDCSRPVDNRNGDDTSRWCQTCGRETGIYGVDWVICGGETGPRARPMHPGWARSLRDQCVSAGVPFFFEQWGEWIPDSQATGIPGPCIVRARFGTISLGGHWSYERYRNSLGECMYRVGKKAAGRLIDGREWNEIPGRV